MCVSLVYFPKSPDWENTVIHNRPANPLLGHDSRVEKDGLILRCALTRHLLVPGLLASEYQYYVGVPELASGCERVRACFREYAKKRHTVEGKEVKTG